MGFRTLEAAKRLIAGGYVKPAYGRKGHLKAIWLLQKDGGNPVETHAKAAIAIQGFMRQLSGYKGPEQ